MVVTREERAFAERHRIGHLATANAAGVPHVVPVCFALVGDYFYFVIDEKPKRARTGLKRLRNLAENPRVALVIDDYDDADWSRLAYLLIRGPAACVTDPAEFTQALHALRTRYAQYRTMPLAFETHPMVRIVPEQRHFWRAAAVD